ncbi:hypothetical protein [Alteromonas macleodii]|uniref:hypothetical protein n=1 Tax=Alteromonas macleodii TaxID=28108 RepID=UPI001927BD9F|nr:hypothetical protein [Alteromonas macleodii]MBL3809561.1 hypothetical protein [Alteromonas macleodii]MBL3883098.1 hypothetical protein [Alteromonas macleodii]
MNTQTQVKPGEGCSIAFDALTSVHELADTLQTYLLESGSIELEAKHCSVISALTEGIKNECKSAQGAVRLVDAN